MEGEIELFVPGRLCLVGEHSDWAGHHRVSNPGIAPGRCIVIPTSELGLFARVKRLPERSVGTPSRAGGLPSLAPDSREAFLAPSYRVLRMRTVAEDGTEHRTELLLSDLTALRHEARAGGFWSYVAGTAYQIGTHFDLPEGLEIDNYRYEASNKLSSVMEAPCGAQMWGVVTRWTRALGVGARPFPGLMGTRSLRPLQDDFAAEEGPLQLGCGLRAGGSRLQPCLWPAAVH